MLSKNLLSEIAQNLTNEDLRSFSMVSKSWHSASKNQSLWRNNFISEWLPEISDKKPQANWKEFSCKALALRSLWKQLGGNIISSSEAESLYSELVSTLKSPPISLPPLRKQENSFPTPFQDLLGNPQDQFIEQPEHEERNQEIDRKITENGPQILSEFNHPTERAILERFRWNLVGTSGSPSSFILKLHRAVEKTVKLFCQASAVMIAEDPCEEYLERWNLYVEAMKKINSMFLSFTETINEVYDCLETEVLEGPKFNLLRMMAVIWRREVFSKVKPLLLSELTSEIATQRQKLLTGEEPDYNEISKLKAVIESVFDISLNELTVYYRNHSKLVLEGPYYELHCFVLEKSFEYYLGSAGDSLNFLKLDKHYIDQIFPSATSDQLAKLKTFISSRRNYTALSNCRVSLLNDENVTRIAKGMQASPEVSLEKSILYSISQDTSCSIFKQLI